MYKAIPEVFFETAKRCANKSALLYKKEGVYFPVTYKELAKKVEVFGACLQDLGVEKGDRVAILSDNRPEWVISDLAAMSIGAIVVPLHTTFNPKALCGVLNHSEAKILIVSDSDLLNKVLLCQKYLKHLKKIIFLEDLSPAQKEMLTSKVLSWRAIFSQNKDKQLERMFLDPDEPCTIVYTSGTTGKPKGVVLTHRNILCDIESILGAIAVKESDVFLSFLPLSHVLERTTGYYIPICYGATIAYAEGVKQLPENLREIRPTIMISVPRVFEKFYDATWDKINSSSNFKKSLFKWALKQQKNTFLYKIADHFVFRKIRSKFGKRLRLTVSGGASLDENIAKFFYKIGLIILEGYGLTETSPVVCVNQQYDFKFGSVGKMIPGVKIKVNENKEILVKGYNVFKEYYKNKKETRECFDREGWFYTGDLGFIDKQGFLTVIGRGKEMIVTSGGKNVWPERIENLINNDRFIAQSMIIGNGRKFISALIVPDWQELEIFCKENGLKMQEHDIIIKNQAILDAFQKRINEKINPSLNEVERIKKFKLLPQEFSKDQDELTPTLKLRRHIIEKHYKKWIDSLYSE